MANHNLVFQTLEPNLSHGMHWLNNPTPAGSTASLNTDHEAWGHEARGQPFDPSISYSLAASS
jgi:hypothetical protein